MPFDEEELDPHGECAVEIARLRAALTEIVGMFRDSQFGTVELDVPFYEVRDVARAALAHGQDVPRNPS
jgi:hypothetical protein